MKKHCIIFAIIIFQLSAYSQEDYTWWEQKHNWDGMHDWYQYLVTSPGFMGPNAIPVPKVKDGAFTNNIEFDLGLEGHFSKGDQTENLYTSLFIPLVPGKAGFHAYMVPWEHYKMDTITRDERRARDYDAKGTSVGDVYLGTYIQIIKNKKKLPDLLLTVNIKTASGGNIEAARFTDTPGYFFDLSAGKDIKSKKNSAVYHRPYAMIGFYCWQTNMSDYHRQDDAFMYGAGYKVGIGKLEIDNVLTGYTGWIDNGDKPMVYRLIVTSKFDSRVNFVLHLQQGINDFEYTSVRFSTKFRFTKTDKQ